MEDKTLLQSPISIWSKKTRKKGPKKPRPICPYCEEIVYVARIEKNRKKEIVIKVGRPKKNTNTRYTKIGHWCYECEIFFYLCGTPNYKLRLRSKKPKSKKR